MLKYLIIALLIITIVKTQETCNFNQTLDGECLRIEKCDYAIQLLKKRIRTSTCRFENGYPIVCCPKEITEYGKTAKEKCEEIKSNYEYREFYYSSVVFGGVNAFKEEYLHMAALGYGDLKDVQWLCGGALISDRFVLTAAHCLGNIANGPVRWVRLGELDLNSTEDAAEPFDFGVKLVIKHPDFKPPSKYNDIALIELERPVRYTKYIKPACIETKEVFNDNNLHATGWGIVDVEGGRRSHLQDVKLNMYTHEECRNAYSNKSKRRLKNGIIESQMCAGGRDELKDTCSGDSGGPLQYQNVEIKPADTYRGYTIVGLTSFGQICGLTKSPGVYTKVSAFVPWIESIVWSKR